MFLFGFLASLASLQERVDFFFNAREMGFHWSMLMAMVLHEVRPLVPLAKHMLIALGVIKPLVWNC